MAIDYEGFSSEIFNILKGTGSSVVLFTEEGQRTGHGPGQGTCDCGVRVSPRSPRPPRLHDAKASAATN